MTKYFLTRVSIEGFRGINNEGDPLVLDFRPDAVNSIFAVNGQGKSSVFEALSYAIRGYIPKLDELPAADDAQSYYVNRFHSGNRAVVGLTLQPDDGSPPIAIRVERSASGTRTVSCPSHSDPQSLLASCASDITLLDYRTFNRFIDDSPLKRGRAFSALLGLGELSEFRQALELLTHGKALKSDFELDSLQATYESATQQAASALIRIQSAYSRLTGETLKDPLDHDAIGTRGAAVLAALPLVKPFVENVPFEMVDFKGIRAAIKKAEGSSERERLASVLREVEHLVALQPGVNEPQEQADIAAGFKKRDAALAATKGPLYLRLFDAAQAVLVDSAWKTATACPLCETTDLQVPIADHVSTHLSAYATAREAQSEIRSRWNTSGWVRRLRELDRLLTPAGETNRAKDIDDAFRLKEPAATDLESAAEILRSFEKQREERLLQLAGEREELERTLPPSLVTLTEQIEQAEQLQSGLGDHKKQNAAASKTKKRLDRYRRWCSFVEDAAKLFADAEVALSTQKTLAIESDYRDLYEKITNNPEVVPLLKKATGSEELHLRLERFYGLTDLSASTLLPESYRNALAISIFLAAAQKATVPARFIVLDDITSSFDSGHQYHVMELLRTAVASPANASGPQVIILSHDGLLEKYFDTISMEPGWHHQRLLGLPPQGAVLTQAQDAQRLRSSAEQFLKAGQTQQASPLIRQYLEYTLQQVIRKLEIPVPLNFAIRDEKKMQQDCLNAINDAIALHEKAGILILEQSQVDDLKKVNVPKLMSNWLNHYATGSAASLSPHVLLGVLTTIDNVSDCFKYTCKCLGGTQRRFYRNLAAKHCSC